MRASARSAPRAPRHDPRRPPRGARLIAVVAIVVATLGAVGPGAPRPAHASPEGDLDLAQRHFRQGEKLYALGRFAEALQAYEQAYEEAPLPELLFNIGQCHRNLRHYDAAIFSFRKYLRELPDAENRDAVELLIVELEEARARQPGANGVLPVEPVGARGRRPIYRRWWFAGGLAAAVTATIVTGVLLWPSDPGLPATDLGNMDFPR